MVPKGGHGTELVASQGFDFPTQYIVRNRQATLQNEAVDKQQQAARRDILLNAKNLCLDLILLNQEKSIDGYPYEKLQMNYRHFMKSV